MKKFMMFALFFATATAAKAEMSMDARFGYLLGESNSLESSTVQSKSGMAVSALRLKWYSKLAEDVTYKMRVNLVPFGSGEQKAGDGSNSNKGKWDSVAPSKNSLLLGGGTPGNQTNDFVTYAQFDIKLADSLTFVVGRLADTGFGGFEGQEAGSSVPFSSQGNVGPSLVGAGFIYSFSDNKDSAGVILANNADATDAGRSASGVFYAGNYGDLGVRVSYHFLPGSSSFDGKTLTGPDAGTAPVTVGAQYKFDNLKLAFDVHQVNYPGRSSNKTDASTTTYLGRVFYTMDGFTPQFRFEQTSRQGLQTKSGVTDVTDSVTNMALSFDYKKQPTDKMSYMFTAISANTAYGNAVAYGGQNANVSGQFYYASVRYDGVLQ